MEESSKINIENKFFFFIKKAYPHISLIIGIPFLWRFTFFGVCHLFKGFVGLLVRLSIHPLVGGWVCWSVGP